MSNSFITWPAPAGEIPSPDYSVDADSTPLFVYQTPVRAEILENEGLWTHKEDYASECASFVIFDMAKPVTIRVKPAKPFKTAVLLPERAGIVPKISNGIIEFTLDKPRKLTLLCDKDDRTALHLFAGEPEKDAPNPSDPNVVYFGPGLHETEGIVLRSGQTLYLAGGAILKAKPKPDDKGIYNEQWKVTFFNGAVFSLKQVEDVRICGRGIVDASLVPHPGFSMLNFDGASKVRIEGVTFCNSANWNFVIGKSNDIQVCDVRIVSGRLNSDGINSVNSRNVRISDCFVRNHDDSIVVKTTAPGIPAEDITVENCVIWSDWGYSLGVTYETRSPVRHILFRSNDIIYSRHWCIGIHVSDSATIEDIRFENTSVSDFAAAVIDTGIRAVLEAKPKLISFAVTQDCWGKDAECGRIRNITVDGVTINGTEMLDSEMNGMDAEHDVRGVTIRNVHLSGKPPVADAAALRLKQNQFVSGVVISG